MSKIKQMLALGFPFLALAAGGELPPSMYRESPKGTGKPIREKNTLPVWKVGKGTVHARNEREAVKYAKKRGYWFDGATVKRLG